MSVVVASFDSVVIALNVSACVEICSPRLIMYGSRDHSFANSHQRLAEADHNGPWDQGGRGRGCSDDQTMVG